MINLILLDDHPVVRHGMRALLDTQPDFTVIEDTGSVDTAATLCATHEVHVALVDVDLGSSEPAGPEAARRILQRSPSTRVLAFSSFDADIDVIRMSEAGATGYLVKDAPPATLFSAIRNAASGATVFPAELAAKLHERTQRPDTALTARELEVLELAAEGRSNRELASHLMLSEATIKTHLHHAFTKLGVESRQAAIARAIKDGLIRLDR